MEDDAIEEDLNGKLPQWKTTLMEDNLNGRQLQWMTANDLKGRRPQGRNTSMEEYLNGSRPQWKPYRKQLTLACLASQFCTELAPAQPLAFLNFSHLKLGIFLFFDNTPPLPTPKLFGPFPNFPAFLFGKLPL